MADDEKTPEVAPEKPEVKVEVVETPAKEVVVEEVALEEPAEVIDDKKAKKKVVKADEAPEATDPGIFPAQYEVEDPWGDTPMQMRS